MATKTTTSSSCSEEDLICERKRKRMLSNRESARRSRMRKQQRLDELIQQVAQLQNENNQVTLQTNVVTEQYLRIEAENNVLRAQLSELNERLKSMHEVLRLRKHFAMTMMNIPPEMPVPLLKPWQLPCSVPTVIASASIFQ